MMKTHKSSFLPFHVCGVSFDAEKSISVKQLFLLRNGRSLRVFATKSEKRNDGMKAYFLFLVFFLVCGKSEFTLMLWCERA